MRITPISPVLVALALVAAGLTGGCGSVPLKAPTGYSFSHALFNGPAPPARYANAKAAPAPKPRPSRPAQTTKPARAADAAVAPLPVTRPEPREEASTPVRPIDSAQRSVLLTAAQRLVGVRQGFDGRGFLHHLLQAGDIRLSGIKSKPSIREVYRALQTKKLTYDRNDPAVGDLVFFHNTEDQNRDGRQNDWYSLVGVVEEAKPDGTITVILPVGAEIVRKVMNLRMPEVRRADTGGAIVNDVLRKKRLDDPPYTQYLTGELFAGFAAVP